MKQLILTLIAFALFSACSSSSEEQKKQTFKITYTDGTTETVSLYDGLAFEERGDCIQTCGCTSEQFKRCGVKMFDLIETIEAVTIVKPRAKPTGTVVTAAKPVIVKKPAQKFKN
jgi:hypothetical protein